jgi:hypothetical protein
MPRARKLNFGNIHARMRGNLTGRCAHINKYHSYSHNLYTPNFTQEIFILDNILTCIILGENVIKCVLAA